jgi:mono/diheme cytochrome c family protein
MAAGHTDQELFNWVSNGVDGTAMPGYAAQLSEQERWDVINYIRSFADQSAGPAVEPAPARGLPAPLLP